jgi:hypothetical protein
LRTPPTLFHEPPPTPRPLGQARAVFHSTGVRPRAKLGCCGMRGARVDLLSHHMGEMGRLQAEVWWGWRGGVGGGPGLGRGWAWAGPGLGLGWAWAGPGLGLCRMVGGATAGKRHPRSIEQVLVRVAGLGLGWAWYAPTNNGGWGLP